MAEAIAPQPEHEEVPNPGRRKFLHDLSLAAAGAFLAAKVGDRVTDEIIDFGRQAEINDLLKRTELEREMQSYQAVRKDASEIDNFFNYPTRNYRQADFKPWLEEIRAHDKWLKNEPDTFAELVDDVLHNRLDERQRRELCRVPEAHHFDTPKVTGFEKIGADSDAVLARVKKLLPPNFLSCTYELKYAPDDGNGAHAQAGRDPNGKGQQMIKYYMNVEGDDNWKTADMSTDALICHEYAHNVDWRLNPFLSDAERIHFFAMITKRLEAKDRYKTEYVAIKNNIDSDPTKWNDIVDLRNGSMEYWSDICELYFSGYQDDWLTDAPKLRLPKADVELIEWVLARMDPEWLKKNCLQYPKSHRETRRTTPE